MWRIVYDVLNNTYIGLMMLSMLHSLVGQNEICAFLRRYWKGHNKVYFRRGWVMLKRIACMVL